MRLSILTLSLLISGSTAVCAAERGNVSGQHISVADRRVNVTMNFDLKSMDVKSRQAAIVTPFLVNGADTLLLEPIGVYGRSRYIQHQRGNDNGVTAPATIIKAGEATDCYPYSASAPYLDWMDGATLGVCYERFGCAGCSAGAPDVVEGLALMQIPKLNIAEVLEYISPTVEREKLRSISGRANIEFARGKTDLREDFRGNYAELSRIKAGIDSARADKDITIKSIMIKGFASPEGSYATNERLAKGRTEAVKRYVEQLYSLPAGSVATAWEPEDWDGLRAWVEASNIGNRDAILDVINNGALAPDARDARLKADFPGEYATLLNTVYPSLRHTDYAIDYTVRAYSDPVEILAIMKTKPQNLGLSEFYIAASSLEPGTDEFNEVFETAVRMYPDDPVANLNAANIALARRDTAQAAKHLAKAGGSPEAVYARGVLATVEGDFDTARRLLEGPEARGVAKSQTVLDYIKAAAEYSALAASSSSKQ